MILLDIYPQCAWIMFFYALRMYRVFSKYFIYIIIKRTRWNVLYPNIIPSHTESILCPVGFMNGSDTSEPFARNKVLCYKNSFWMKHVIPHHPPLFFCFLYFCEFSWLQKIIQVVKSGQEHMADTLRFTVWQTAFSTFIQTSLEVGRRRGYHGDSKQEAAGVLEA